MTFSGNNKLCNYSTVVLSQALFAVETTIIKEITEIHDIQNQGRKIYEAVYMTGCGLSGQLRRFIKAQAIPT